MPWRWCMILAARGFPFQVSFTRAETCGMRKLFVATVVVALGWLVISLTSTAQEKAKVTIKDVMKTAHKGGLMAKVAKGEASADEKKQLVELYTALAADKPPKGDEASWKEKTSNLLAAAKEAAEGKEGAGEKLRAAANCMACHSVHKGK